MPPFVHFAKMQDFYRFAFLPDGYPGRAGSDGSIFPHPIYGTYALIDYLKQYARDPRPELLQAISRVAHAAISRMTPFNDTLVFWYEANPSLGARLYADHYSGLTQAYYAVQLARAGTVLEDASVRTAAESVFRSLLVPAEAGGVLHRTPAGPVIAEVPQTPNSWILNGWLSALTSIQEFSDITGLDEARDLIHDSTRTMARVLHLYDEPVKRTSRYGLTGFAYLRLRFEHLPQSLQDVTLHIPGEPDIVLPTGSGTRWQPYVFGPDMVRTTPKTTTVRINAVLSLASAPEPNRVGFTATTESPGTVTLEGMLGAYEPTASSPVNAEWKEIASTTIPSGTSSCMMDIPAFVVDSTVYPTNFAKKIEGQNVNVYHSIHIQRLRQLHGRTGVDELLTWADKWHGYIADWATMPTYSGLAFRDPVSGKVRPVTDQPAAIEGS
ncbi:D-glucuronyl C5-epimerase family protein [Occultella glacieicola]|nr:D-glucuronyl C5-epimerase family protein [Occultella glacieicola]